MSINSAAIPAARALPAQDVPQALAALSLLFKPYSSSKSAPGTLSNKMFLSQAPLQLSLLSAGFFTLSIPDGDDEGQHFQQDGNDEHHDGRGRRRGCDHSVFQETRDGEDEEDCGGQEHVQERAEGCTGKSLHWSIPYNLCGIQG